jgi:hypothetical protein
MAPSLSVNLAQREWAAVRSDSATGPPRAPWARRNSNAKRMTGVAVSACARGFRSAQARYQPPNQCSKLTPMFIEMHRNAPLSPMKRVPGCTTPMHLWLLCTRANSSTAPDTYLVSQEFVWRIAPGPRKRFLGARTPRAEGGTRRGSLPSRASPPALAPGGGGVSMPCTALCGLYIESLSTYSHLGCFKT